MSKPKTPPKPKPKPDAKTDSLPDTVLRAKGIRRLGELERRFQWLGMSDDTAARKTRADRAIAEVRRLIADSLRLGWVADISDLEGRFDEGFETCFADDFAGLMGHFADGCAYAARVIETEAKVRELRGEGEVWAAAKATARDNTRARRRKYQARDITEKQVEAVQVFGDCDGNVTEAAKRLGITRKAFRQRYSAAMKKLGVTMQSSPWQVGRAQRQLEAVGRSMKKTSMKFLPTDKRGAVTVESKEKKLPTDSRRTYK